MPDPVSRFLSKVMTRPRTSWTMGSIGAGGRFQHVPDEPASALPGGCGSITARGGIRLENISSIHPIAWEVLSPPPQLWHHGVALCMKPGNAQMSGRVVLTELGPDHGALRQQDRHAILFDLGLAQRHMDFCIRTDDRILIARLRAEAGKPVTGPDSRVLPAILLVQPHRVALTRIGRIEVFQNIADPKASGQVPPGPCSYLRPRLLHIRHNHRRDIQIPDDLVPIAQITPPPAQRDDHSFDTGAFDDFQQYLARWGNPAEIELKARLWQAVAAGQTPDSFILPPDRLSRLTARIALRQTARRHGLTISLSEWLAGVEPRLADIEACLRQRPGP